MCLFHKWVRVEDVDHERCIGPERSWIDSCFKEPHLISEELKAKNPEYRTKGYCPHSWKVCAKCGKAVGYGSHGKISEGIIPANCVEQIRAMGGKVK